MKREEVTCDDCRIVNRCWDEPIPHPLNCREFDNPELINAIKKQEYDFALMKQVTAEVLDLVDTAATLTRFESDFEREQFYKFINDIPRIMEKKYG